MIIVLLCSSIAGKRSLVAYILARIHRPHLRSEKTSRKKANLGGYSHGSFFSILLTKLVKVVYLPAPPHQLTLPSEDELAGVGGQNFVYSRCRQA